MSEYLHVEKPLRDQLGALGWQVIDQGSCVPGDPNKSLRASFREWLLPEVLREAVRSVNVSSGTLRVSFRSSKNDISACCRHCARWVSRRSKHS